MSFTATRPPHLTLVYSAAANGFSDSSKAAGAKNSLADAWLQIELFATEQPDTVIFASPERCRLASLVALVASSHVRQIFDCRELPHLSFEGGTRARFFEALSGLNVKYFSAMEMETKGHTLREKGVFDALTLQIDKGPTMVFSDLDPELDPDVQQLNESLSKSGVRFKPVFLTFNDAN